MIGLGMLMGLATRAPWIYSWFGNLPGDIKYSSKHTYIFAPLASMLLISAVMSVIAYLLQRFLR